jgi:hypothetical protein
MEKKTIFEQTRRVFETSHRSLQQQQGSANFVQVSGPGGRVQSFTAGGATQTWIFNPASLKGTTPGGDFMYASRMRARVTGSLLIGAGGITSSPTWEALARTLGQVRVFSPFLGEMVNKSLNSVPLLMNHDMFFCNGFKPITRQRPRFNASSGLTIPIEYEFEIPFERDYLTRSTDSCPWLPFLEGGIVEIDLAPNNVLSLYNVTATGTWSCELVIDWFTDKQAIIHAPCQSRLYRVTTGGPEYLLKAVGSPNGLDGVVMGSRLAVLSWLMKGISHFSTTASFRGASSNRSTPSRRGSARSWPTSAPRDTASNRHSRGPRSTATCPAGRTTKTPKTTASPTSRW